MTKQLSQCSCGTTLHKSNRTGRCRPCGIRAAYRSAEMRAKRSRSMKEVWQRPGYRENIRQKVSEKCRSPEERAERSKRAKAMHLNRLGVEAARDPLVLMRKKRRIALTKMPWCPPEYLAEVRRLRAMRFTADEIKDLILKQKEADNSRLRNRMNGSSLP